MSSVSGRSGIITLFRECVAWPRPAGRALPIVLLLGPSGSGKTALLRELRDQAADLPHAYVDLETRESAGPVDVLIELGNQLSIGHRGLGRLRFPRFWLGLLVTELVLERQPPEEQRLQVQDLLARIRPFRRFPVDLREFVVRLAALKGVDRAGATAAVDAIEQTIRLWRGPAQRWWAGRGNQSATDSLLRLKVAFDSRCPIDRREVEEELCEAFLADLRATYANPFRGPDRTVSCVAMIDNAHTDGGAELVELLARLRAEPAAEPDPLLVFATSRHALSERLVPEPDAVPESVRLADWTLAHDRESWRSWCCPVRLRDLDLDEVDRLARIGGLRSRGALASFAHRLTGGHPRGVRAVLDLVERRHADAPHAVLTLGGGDLLDELLADVPAEHRAALVSCAAARHVNLPAILAALGYAPHLGAWDDAAHEEAREVATRVLAKVGDLLWLRGAGPTAELHPWLRRLLLWELARRPDGDANSWTVVHDRLRDHSRATGDRAGELYHELAVGNVPNVVRALDAELRAGTDPATWKATLLAVTSAPSRPTDDEPGGRARELAGWAHAEDRRVRALTWLVSARWVAADPLGDPFGRLQPEIAHRWQILSGEVPHASDAFFEAGQEVLRDYGRNGGLVENLPSWRGNAGASGAAREQGPGRIVPAVSGRRAILRVLSAVTAVCVVGAGVTALARQADRCGEGVTRMDDGQCVGVTDGAYRFDGLAQVLTRIEKENGRPVPPRVDTVTIAVAMPIPHGGLGVLSTEAVRRELEGAYLAQVEANERSGGPRIRLAVANIGRNAEYWGPVVEQLEELPGLRVVSGLGPSLDSTGAAVRELGRHDIATIGSVITADDLRGPALARIAPSNKAQVVAAVHAQLLTERTLLVRDNKSDDSYVRTLAEQFLSSHSNAGVEAYDSADDVAHLVPQRMSEITREICASDYDQVYFAGRHDDLRQFVIALNDRQCRDRPLTVVSGDDAAVIDIDEENPEHDEFSDALADGNVTVLCTALAHPRQWTGTPGRSADVFAEFEKDYGRTFGAGRLDDGQAMVSHDAVATAVEAIRRDGVGDTMWLGVHGTGAVDGVTGPIDLDEHGDPIAKPIPILRINPDGSKSFEKLATTPTGGRLE